MAVTQTQQYFADKSITQDPDECCRSLGGDLVIDSDGTPLCSFETYEFPRSQACQYALQNAEQAPTQAGGLGNWLATNAAGIGSAIGTTFESVFSTITGTPTPAQQLAASAAAAEEERKRKNRQVVVGLVIFVVIAIVGVYLIKKRKK